MDISQLNEEEREQYEDCKKILQIMQEQHIKHCRPYIEQMIHIQNRYVSPIRLGNVNDYYENLKILNIK